MIRSPIDKRKKPTEYVAYMLVFMLVLSVFTIVFAANNVDVTIENSGAISYGAGPLHVEGRYVKNNKNQTVILRGANMARFIDTPYGDWMLPNGGVVWATWDTNAATANLDTMKSWGMNVVRTLATIEWWANNTGGHRQIIKDWITLAGSRGMYVVYGFWRVTGSSTQNSLPYPPYCESNNYIKNETDFVELWRGIANELKGYPNVLFELWNEPNGPIGAEDSWFNTTQQCITAIRATGAQNIIVVQWGFALGVDYAGFSSFNQGSRVGSIWTLDWINNHILSDPAGNLLYSSHLYRNSFYDSSQGYKQVGEAGWVNYTSDDLAWALNITGVTTFNKPVWIGEIGPNQWNTADLDNEYNWYSATLSILNENERGYAAWWWWYTGTAFGHIFSGQPNYAPNRAGQILQTRLRA